LIALAAAGDQQARIGESVHQCLRGGCGRHVAAGCAAARDCAPVVNLHQAVEHNGQRFLHIWRQTVQHVLGALSNCALHTTQCAVLGECQRAIITAHTVQFVQQVSHQRQRPRFAAGVGQYLVGQAILKRQRCAFCRANNHLVQRAQRRRWQRVVVGE
jgi:hypothetical protein